MVLAVAKTPTAGLEVEYRLDGDPVPTPSTREAVIDADGRFAAVIETTECRVLPMSEVDDAFARDEGEGFADAADWRRAHERFWNGYLAELRERLGDPTWSLSDETLIVCQRFRLVEAYPEPLPPEGQPPEGHTPKG